ncbi:glycosyltransferase family 4 protein [Flavobacterium xanthum]|uniref:Glycosyltransferase involved in cell wall bisynthesis n=1 Tax=Flavobacterium xanthum TaxID=69322 RepID=A0A1M6YB17_9FLAO|nr:glycosyltransferase [Flavobacterium xanthum]SHL15428.1 Glycosyltransferase involved in cell wall bisynthesis [Flavobacterium xanthum]
MKFIFWQNIVSMHQSSFLRNLGENHQVDLIVSDQLDDSRRKQGWSIPNLGKVNISIISNEIDLRTIIDSECIHIFSGISAFPFVYSAFKKSIKKGVTIGVMLEPFDDIGILGLIRKFKYTLLRIRYASSIDFILTTGEKGRICYEAIGFKKETIFDWGYFVENNIVLDKNYLKQKVRFKANILFVGEINKNKNILSLIDKCIEILTEEDQLCIVGSGPLSVQLSNKIDNCSTIRYLGNIPNEKVIQLMQSYDLLVLPSIYDGWGAVINEALQAGMQVIASENCGASILLDGCHRGEVFSFSGKNDFDQVLAKWLKKEPLTKEKRIEIAKWSANHISGEVAASYFESVIRFTLGNEVTRPIAPWLKK